MACNLVPYFDASYKLFYEDDPKGAAISAGIETTLYVVAWAGGKVIRCASRCADDVVKVGDDVVRVGDQAAKTTVDSGAVNPRLMERLDAWRAYKARGGPLDMRGWVQRTQGAPWGTGAKSGYGQWIRGIESTHGNSLFSQRPAYLYRLEDPDGNLLKWGITQDMNARYSQSFLYNKKMLEVTSGRRSVMSALERNLVRTQPGPFNLEPWAGAGK